jgi:hypothetical protein
MLAARPEVRAITLKFFSNYIKTSQTEFPENLRGLLF